MAKGQICLIQNNRSAKYSAIFCILHAIKKTESTENVDIKNYVLKENASFLFIDLLGSFELRSYDNFFRKFRAKDSGPTVKICKSESVLSEYMAKNLSKSSLKIITIFDKNNHYFKWKSNTKIKEMVVYKKG
ncbi:hypothetical protein BpHYR1_012517 [Brachionus plicatilis]|uniref:Uncharacterized protein n=1 Tax=Brachionus plicatilis TaxID=10195 RepID=A0A3M7PH74_BRAPC|nr:hypothetical protein BpHYR1_012517 [Brachionus plicatilis]